MESKATRAAQTASDGLTSGDELALRGGLRGRMAGAFCTLQSSVDALQRYLEANAPPAVRKNIRPMLDEMANRLAYLERISNNAARLATGTMTRGCEDMAPLELGSYLTEFTSFANEELALRGLAARVLFADRSGSGPIWVSAATNLLDGILVNLLSNFMQATHCTGTMQLTLQPGRALLYSDDGPGMDMDTARALLEQGRPPVDMLDRGALGLLLVRDYAAAMRWTIHVEEGDGFRVQFAFPEFSAPASLLLRDGACGRSSVIWTHLRQELDGVFGCQGSGQG